MPFTHYLANALIDSIIADNTSLWLAAFTASPDKTGGGTECAGGSYARVEMDSDVIFDGASDSSDESTAVVEFPQATASWGTIVAVGIYDASTSGNLLMYAAVSPGVPIANGDQYRFPIGNLIIKNV